MSPMFSPFPGNVVETFLDQTYTYDPATGRMNGVQEQGSGMSSSHPYNPAIPLIETVETSVGGTKRLAMTRTHDRQDAGDSVCRPTGRKVLLRGCSSGESRAAMKKHCDERRA